MSLTISDRNDDDDERQPLEKGHRRYLFDIEYSSRRLKHLRRRRTPARHKQIHCININKTNRRDDAEQFPACDIEKNQVIYKIYNHTILIYFKSGVLIQRMPTQHERRHRNKHFGVLLVKLTNIFILGKEEAPHTIYIVRVEKKELMLSGREIERGGRIDVSRGRFST